MTAAARKADDVRLITLTAPDDTRPLADRLDDLYEAFRRWRRLNATKRHVRGGIAVVEVTRNHAKGTWHPHIHVLCDGNFWCQKAVAASWSIACPGAVVVDIRKVHGLEGAGRYLAKYVAKEGNLSRLTPEEVREYAAAMHRRRLVLTFGSLHGSSVADDDEEETSLLAEECVTTPTVLANLCQDPASRERRALRVLATVERRLIAAMGDFWEPWEHDAMQGEPDPQTVRRAASVLIAAVRAAELAITEALVRQIEKCPPRSPPSDWCLPWA